VLERERERRGDPSPITNAKNKKPERTAANPIRIPSKNPPNCLPHLQEQEQQESILVGKKIGEKKEAQRDQLTKQKGSIFVSPRHRRSQTKSPLLWSIPSVEQRRFLRSVLAFFFRVKILFFL
jgi:serine/threonine-protein phosphatase PP1 catalytic subunit